MTGGTEATLRDVHDPRPRKLAAIAAEPSVEPLSATIGR